MTFRRNISPPSSGLKNKPPHFKFVSCSAYSSTLKMEAICSSETSVDFQRTTRRYIPGDSTLNSVYFLSYDCNMAGYISKKLELIKTIIQNRLEIKAKYFPTRDPNAPSFLRHFRVTSCNSNTPVLYRTDPVRLCIKLLVTHAVLLVFLVLPTRMSLL
jgi:hypothetical protein